MTAKKQREVFQDAYNELMKVNSNVALQLISDMYDTICRKVIILKKLLLRQYANGSDVAIITCGVFCKYPKRDCYINMNILYPLLGLQGDRIRVFILNTDDTTINRRCGYITKENEIIVDQLDQWTPTTGFTYVIQRIMMTLQKDCPVYEISSYCQIPLNQLEFLEKLGSGTSATVYRGKYNGKIVALKKYKDISSKHELVCMNREFETQMKYKNPYIVEIYGYSRGPDTLPILVMEFGRATLDDIIIKSKNKISNEKKKSYLLQIASGLAYLHSNNVIHRDLKLANILLVNDVVKLADFGYAREIVDNKSILISTCGSPAFMAPELIKNYKCSTKIDIYSFGCVIYEIIERKKCYWDYKFKSTNDFYDLVLHGIRPTLNVGMPREPVQLMKRCWLEDKLRPTMKEIVSIIEKWDVSTWTTNVTTEADLKSNIYICLL